MQIKIIYLATFGMIFLDFVFRKYKWSKVEFSWKEWPLTLQPFSAKNLDGHSKRERVEIIELHLN